MSPGPRRDISEGNCLHPALVGPAGRLRRKRGPWQWRSPRLTFPTRPLAPTTATWRGSWPASDSFLPGQTPRSLDCGVLGVGWGEVKFQTFMQKSFTCKAHLPTPPLWVLFPYYTLSLRNPGVSSSSFFHLLCLLPAASLASRQAPRNWSPPGSSFVVLGEGLGPWLLADQGVRHDPAAQLWLCTGPAEVSKSSPRAPCPSALASLGAAAAARCLFCLLLQKEQLAAAGVPVLETGKHGPWPQEAAS